MAVQSIRPSLFPDLRASSKPRREASDVEQGAETPVAFATWAKSPYVGAERRLSIRLEGYWRSLRRCARGPFFQDFWPSRNPIPWTNCFLAYVSGPGVEPVFDHIGGSIIAVFKPDRTNLPDREWLSDTTASHFGGLADALTTATPVRRDGRFERRDGIVALYRSVLLPFVDLKREPTYVLGAVTYRLQAPSAT